MVARDRTGAYADGIRQGAPEAIPAAIAARFGEVTDRWHPLRNLGEAFYAVVERHRATARRVGREMMVARAAEAAQALASAIVCPNAAARRSEASRARRHARFAEAARLHTAGASLSGISRLLGADRKTLRRWLQAGGVPAWQQPRRSSVLDPYRGRLERRWAEGCRNAARLWRELTAMGFPGRPATVRSWATRQRTVEPDASRPPTTAGGQPWRPPSSRRVARLLMAGVNDLPDADHVFATRLLAEAPALDLAAAKRLALCLQKKSTEALGDVLAVSEATLLAPFVAELRKDTAAVQAALDTPWTTSPVEGQINHIKTIKPSMYGRAGFDLLRAHILNAA